MIVNYDRFKFNLSFVFLYSEFIFHIEFLAAAHNYFVSSSIMI